MGSGRDLTQGTAVPGIWSGEPPIPLGLHKTIEIVWPGDRTGQPPETWEAGPTLTVVLPTPSKRALAGRIHVTVLVNSRAMKVLQALNCTFLIF
ncbi:hypothetical protein GCM10027176_10730 [Actinoallomurus bryophytorum]